MEGKRITELSGTSTAAGEGLRFSCHFEENSISFRYLEGLKVKIGGLGLASFCPGPQGNIRGVLNMLRDFPQPLYSINLFPLLDVERNPPYPNKDPFHRSPRL